MFRYFMCNIKRQEHVKECVYENSVWQVVGRKAIVCAPIMRDKNQVCLNNIVISIKNNPLVTYFDNYSLDASNLATRIEQAKSL